MPPLFRPLSCAASERPEDAAFFLAVPFPEERFEPDALVAGLLDAAFLDPRRLRLASATALRLVAPRTGFRGRKIHPTPGTCLAPRRRPSVNSHS